MVTTTAQKPLLRVRIARAGWLYCILVTVVLFIASYVQANLLFWIFGLMAASLIVSLLMPLMMIHKLSVIRRAPSHGISGEMLILQYELTNHLSWLPIFGVLIHENWGDHDLGWQHSGPVSETPARLNGCPHGWAIHVGPQQCITTKAPCWPLRRGMLRLEQIVVSTSFPFGIFEWRLEFDQQGEILVYPHMYRMNRRAIATLKDQDTRGQRQVNRAGGNEEFYGLREYHESDSIKLIHWRRSAHSGQMVSKEMTYPSPPKVMVLLDLTQHPSQLPPNITHDQLVEQAISLASSIVSEAHHFGHRVGLAVQGTPCPTFEIEHSVDHRLKMLEALARLDTANRLIDYAPSTQGPSVIVCTGEANSENAGGSSGGSSGGGSGGAVILSAAHLEKYVLDAGITSPANIAVARKPAK